VKRYLVNLHRRIKGDVKENVLSLCRGIRADSLVDCGCYDGIFTMQIARATGARRAVGLDVLDVNVKNAVSNGVEAYRANLNEKLPLPDGVFDVAIANEVIDFLLNTDGFVRELNRVLKPGGYVVISTTNIASWHSVLLLALGRQPPAIPVSNEVATSGWDMMDAVILPDSARVYRACKVFTLKAMKEMLEFHGFSVEKVKASGYYPLPAPLGRVMNVLDKTHSAYFTVKARKS
jgi:ubiquinone/menaquinone biosynthesis C-methylase UbiE